MIKKRMVGKSLQSLNSIEYIANQYSQESYGDASLFDLVPVIESITLSQVKELATQFMVPERMSVFHILPKEAKES